jgi:hypothetical protein
MSDSSWRTLGANGLVPLHTVHDVVNTRRGGSVVQETATASIVITK